MKTLSYKSSKQPLRINYVVYHFLNRLTVSTSNLAQILYEQVQKTLLKSFNSVLCQIFLSRSPSLTTTNLMFW